MVSLLFICPCLSTLSLLLFLRQADDIEKDVENNASMARQRRLAIAQKTALQIAKVKASPWTRKVKAKEAEKKRKRQAGMASPCEPPPPPPPPPVEQDIDSLCECMIVRCLLAHHWYYLYRSYV